MNKTTEITSETRPSLAEAILAQPFVQGMSAAHLQMLTEVAMFKEFEPGELVFSEGEPANRFYLICRGKIALEFSGPGDSVPLVQFLGEGEVLGWSWLFPPYYWHFSARAVEPTSAIFLYGARLREVCEQDPAFGYSLMERVAAIVIKRLQTTRLQLLQLQRETSRGASVG